MPIHSYYPRPLNQICRKTNQLMVVIATRETGYSTLTAIIDQVYYMYFPLFSMQALYTCIAGV